jgi:hypothetical protein
MEPCYYHPQAKAKSTCAACHTPVCDRCRLDGDMTRCAACVENGTPVSDAPMEAEAVVPQAAVDDYTPPMCTNHATLAADMQCLNCFRPFCLSCASTGYCPDCAPQFVSKQNAAAAQMAASAPAYEEQYADPGYGQGYEQPYEPSFDQGYGQDFAQSYDAPADGGFDLAGSYLDDAPAPPPPPRPKKRPPGEGPAKKGPAAKGGKKPAPKKGGGGMPKGAIAGGVVALLLVAGGGYWFMTKGSAAGDEGAEAAGPTKVSISAPKAGKVKGAQVIKLKVASPDDLDHVELTIDGKYWGKFKEAPFESDWPTGIFKNGKHKVVAKAIYKGGKSVSDSHEYVVENPN